MKRDPAEVLVLDADAHMRRLLRAALELEGFRVVEAASSAQARMVLDQPLFAAVVDCPAAGLDANGEGDGDGELHRQLSRRIPADRIFFNGEEAPAGVRAVARGDLDAILVTLRSLRSDPVVTHLPADQMARRLAAAISSDWRELCLWDPALPAESQPPLAESVITAVCSAMERPQPLGWGVDPALESISETFVLNAEGVDVAVAQLVCLREAFDRRLIALLPGAERAEASQRLNMILHRMMTVVVRTGMARLASQASTDPLTGLLNRRAFEADLCRERSRAERHSRPLSLIILDLDGLKRVNDTEGHAAGDRALASLAHAIKLALRNEDTAYRLGGDEFAVLLPDTVVASPDFLVNRLTAAGAPPFSVGAASYPADNLDRLPELADARLYEGRRRRGWAGVRTAGEVGAG